MSVQARNTLFGGQRGWNADDWTASDDRVRGGKSQSYLRIKNDFAIFQGNLDIETLGGAGFASQRTTGDGRCWDLSGSDGIELLIQPQQSDDKRYTFILKDEILPPNPENGREQSTTSWEYDFRVRDAAQSQLRAGLASITIPWGQFKPTYRGKEKDPGRTIDLANVRRISVMMRSFFGDQYGTFSLCLESITAVPIDDKNDMPNFQDEAQSSTDSDSNDPKAQQHESRSIWAKLFGPCYRL